MKKIIGTVRKRKVRIKPGFLPDRKETKYLNFWLLAEDQAIIPSFQ